jgi:hypothetical protein
MKSFGAIKKSTISACKMAKTVGDANLIDMITGVNLAFSFKLVMCGLIASTPA